MEEKDLSQPPVEVTDDVADAPTSEEVKASIMQETNALIAWILACRSLTFLEFESQLVPKVLALGCLFVQLFLCMRAEQFQATRPSPSAGYKRMDPKPRRLGTFFGKVRYWRTYFYRAGGATIRWIWNWD
ncbi:MAG: hypothetical protein MAG451_01769 [Anaerolineales bacterium]|nr:hypothetical protein [Anaerolineales bacterium]